MADGFTAFMTYMLVSDNDITSGATQGYGYSKAIHCNYIKSEQLQTLDNKEFNIYFEDEDIGDFKFLSVSGGTGFTAHKIIMLAQLIDNEPYDSINDIKPFPNKWVSFDVTNQIDNYVPGQLLSPEDICSAVYRIPAKSYYTEASNGNFYNLDYLNYPQKNSPNLSFGDEVYFMGNVTTSIEAVAHTMDLGVNLPLNQFNSSNNVTWNSDLDERVYITEVGLYDDNKNLVGIAKLNNPLPKDDTIARTIVFAMDF
jgi:hypothetical protein